MCLKIISEPQLTSQERSLLYLTARGDTLAAAAKSLSIAVVEAQAILDRMQERLNLPSRSSLIVYAVVQGWV